MEVFICWSGTASHVLAEGLRKWLPLVIQAVKPFLSSEDIRKGSRWSAELHGRLARINFGILRMTPENLQEPWIHFESGALSKNLESGSVSALLLAVKFSDLSKPLQLFQHTQVTREDIFKLVASINRAVSPPLDDERLELSFNAHWKDFEKVIQDAREALVSTSVVAPEKRDPAETLDEVLSGMRDVQRQLAPVAEMLDRLSNTFWFQPGIPGLSSGLAGLAGFNPGLGGLNSGLSTVAGTGHVLPGGANTIQPGTGSLYLGENNTLPLRSLGPEAGSPQGAFQPNLRQAAAASAEPANKAK